MGPEDGVLVEILSWVEPKIVSFLSSNFGAPISIDICLEPPLLSPNVSQELEV